MCTHRKKNKTNKQTLNPKKKENYGCPTDTVRLRVHPNRKCLIRKRKRRGYLVWAFPRAEGPIDGGGQSLPGASKQPSWKQQCSPGWLYRWALWEPGGRGGGTTTVLGRGGRGEVVIRGSEWLHRQKSGPSLGGKEERQGGAKQGAAGAEEGSVQMCMCACMCLCVHVVQGTGRRNGVGVSSTWADSRSAREWPVKTPPDLSSSMEMDRRETLMKLSLTVRRQLDSCQTQPECPGTTWQLLDKNDEQQGWLYINKVYIINN